MKKLESLLSRWFNTLLANTFFYRFNDTAHIIFTQRLYVDIISITDIPFTPRENTAKDVHKNLYENRDNGQ